VPRIRTIKPEFCTSEQVADCSTNARLLFVLMWCFCDDGGRHPANAKRLKMECFPGDSFTVADIQVMIEELIKNGLIIEYRHENSLFWQVTGWKKHQKIDKASFKYGPLDSQGRAVEFADSAIVRRVFDEHSTTPHPRNGMEGNGEESTGEEGSHSCGIDEKSPKSAPEASGFYFVVCDGSEWSLSLSKFNEYRKTFPELDLGREFRKAAQWLRDRPKNRKTPKGMHAFLGSWLSRAQNSGQSTGGVVQKTFAQLKVENTHAAGDAWEAKMQDRFGVEDAAV